MKSREYLSFTKRERIGIISLVILLIIVSAVPKFFFRPESIAENIPSQQLERLSGHKADSSNHYSRPYHKLNYKRAYEQGHPGFRSFNSNNNKRYKNYDGPRTSTHKKSRLPLMIYDINTADTTAFISLPGIGSKLAARIILFREKLGGFFCVEQISEVYGLADSVFRKIAPRLTCNPSDIVKIDINLADKEDLKKHPYIRWNIANALVGYRNQHGEFVSLSDLSRISNIDSGTLNRMMPYLTLK